MTFYISRNFILIYCEKSYRTPQGVCMIHSIYNVLRISPIKFIDLDGFYREFRSKQCPSMVTRCGVARIIYRQSDCSAYGYIASYQCGYAVEFHKLCAKDVNCHVWFMNINTVLHIDIYCDVCLCLLFVYVQYIVIRIIVIVETYIRNVPITMS